MNASVLCPQPARCGALSHRVGSDAARECARAPAPGAAPATAPAPPPPFAAPGRTRSHEQVFADLFAEAAATVVGAGARDLAALEAALAADDAAHGWDPASGRAHPSGGYVRRVTTPASESFTGGVEVRHFDADGEMHNADGPASVRHAPGGGVNAMVFYDHGRCTRADGPSTLVLNGRHATFQDGWIMSPYSFLPGEQGDLPSPAQRFEVLREGVGEAATALAWLDLQRRVAGVDLVDDQEPRSDVVGAARDKHRQAAGVVDHLVEVGADPAGAVAALAALGARPGLDGKGLLAVLVGELPASWAATGS